MAWNYAHGWVSYFKQGGRVTRADPARSLQYLAELIFGQLGLVTPISFGLMAAGIWRLGSARNAVAALLLWLTLLPIAIFLENTFAERVQANWPAIIYPAACIAAACLPTATLTRWLKPALACGFLMTLLVYAQAAAALLPIPPARDPAALQLAGWGRRRQPARRPARRVCNLRQLRHPGRACLSRAPTASTSPLSIRAGSISILPPAICKAVAAY